MLKKRVFSTQKNCTTISDELHQLGIGDVGVAFHATVISFGKVRFHQSHRNIH